MSVRVRFAPSPTGHLHLGGARTALYNYLFARQNKGKFVLRIEDTDLSRSTEMAIQSIIDDLYWLGLEWDEGPDIGGSFGPYRQTQRSTIYQKYLKILMDKGYAYYCFCSPEELQSQREEARKKKITFRYNRRCRNLSSEERESKLKKNPKPSIRFASPLRGETEVRDIVRGKIVFNHSELDDFVIFRSDGTPTYNFAATIDDATMKITHVIRGDDHLPNTPKQINIYRALGFKIPEFAHLSMILGPDKKPLSKRHGDTAIFEYRRKGFLPSAMVNYLALLGWSYDDKTTFFRLEELIKFFSLNRVSKNPAVFDLQKLKWLNGHYIRQLKDNELFVLVEPYFQKKFANFDSEKLMKAIPLIKERIAVLSETVDWLDCLFTQGIVIDKEAQEKIKDENNLSLILKAAHQSLSQLDDFVAEKIQNALREKVAELQVKPKVFFQTIRLAITGKLVSPPLFESIEILGKKETLNRLKKFLEDFS